MTKATWIGCGLLAALAWSWRSSAEATYAEPVAGFGSRELVTHFQESTTGPTALTVIDPAAKVLAVYHVSRDTGEIKLKSVRNFDWDLRLVEFNSSSPTPDEIRQGFDRQQ